jgi:hypothetical protein
VGERVRGDKNLGADPILRFLALLDWVDEASAAERRAERVTRQTRREHVAARIEAQEERAT